MPSVVSAEVKVRGLLVALGCRAASCTRTNRPQCMNRPECPTWAAV